MLIFSKYKYLHVKIASLANVKSCVTMGPISLTEDTLMITVSSCGVKLQEVLSGLEKERLKHWKYTCIFVAFLNITILYFFFFFPLGV